MIKDKSIYKILIIEDNPGDLYLFKEYLKDQIISPEISSAKNFEEAIAILSSEVNNVFDIIFLDLSLPDKKGEDLILEIVKLSSKKPIVVLTGYSDIQFSIKSLHLGVSDYLVKDDITALTLYKSLRYNIERSKYIAQIEQSEERYADLFHLSPQPMFIYDVETLQFIDVNKASVDSYGYTHDEFLAMTIKDIRPKDDVGILKSILNKVDINKTINIDKYIRHQKKDGTIIYVEITSNLIPRKNKSVRVVLATDVTSRVKYTEEIINQNERLKEIAWIQSHVVRAPLARLMGIIHLLRLEEDKKHEKSHFLFDEALKATDELDEIIRDITEKTSNIDINEDKDEI
ncbi:response regulator [Cellulophaga baltica]|uniref:response regulator n=1 Tax=Cellulophaga TaxID=104264 RepID=UPI001C071673|nr:MULTISPECIES: response regulator [Cellulophaga]MBU2995271.1 response regulator [Cellulophaga baltica]MDO6766666.1 response regulator [Cellulophaga sp. 1_MG-2023]